MRAWDEERDFIELVRADAEVAQHLDAVALDEVFDLAATVRHVDTVFERLHALVGKGEPVHA
jgi:adenylosuccinate lyase